MFDIQLPLTTLSTKITQKTSPVGGGRSGTVYAVSAKVTAKVSNDHMTLVKTFSFDGNSSIAAAESNAKAALRDYAKNYLIAIERGMQFTGSADILNDGEHSGYATVKLKPVVDEYEAVTLKSAGVYDADTAVEEAMKYLKFFLQCVANPPVS